MNPKNIALVTIGGLKDTASWQSVHGAIAIAALHTVPVELFRELIEVFETKVDAGMWLIEENTALAGVPLDLYNKGYHTEVLQCLKRTTHGVVE